MNSGLYWYEQSEQDVPLGIEWLSAREILHLRRLHVPKRAADWRLGRWTVKRAVADRMGVESAPRALAAIEILAGANGAPICSIAGAPPQWNISISHSGGRAACAITKAGAAIGCDLEQIEERDPSFLAGYFTAEEQKAFAASAAQDVALLATLFWSAKESALKLLQEGLRMDTRTVSVARPEGPVPCSLWNPLQVRLQQDRLLRGWWRAGSRFVETVMCEPAMPPPQVYCLPAPGWSLSRRGLDAYRVAYATAD